MVLLHESYRLAEIENALNNQRGRDIIYAHGSIASNGTMIMFRPDLDIDVIDVCADKNGCYDLLKLQFMCEKFPLNNIYAA